MSKWVKSLRSSKCHILKWVTLPPDSSLLTHVSITLAAALEIESSLVTSPSLPGCTITSIAHEPSSVSLHQQGKEDAKLLGGKWPMRHILFQPIQVPK